MYLIIYELAEPGLVHVYTAGLAVVYLAVHHRGVGARLHFETGDPIVVDVVGLKVALVRGCFIVFISFKLLWCEYGYV